MRALLVLAGDSPDRHLLMQEYTNADLRIAVDGGLEDFSQLELKPDVIVGDLDSVRAGLVEQYDVPLLQAQAEKNETDSMLALDYAIEQGATEVVMLGALGDRMDHAVSNLLMLRRAYGKNVQMELKDERQTIMLKNGDFEIHAPQGTTVSLIPARDQATVTESWIYYPLERLNLHCDEGRGVSNTMLSEVAQISTDDFLWVFLSQRV